MNHTADIKSEVYSRHDPAELFPDLPVGIFRLGFRTSPRSQSYFSGSTWYGLFKQSLFDTTCRRKLQAAACDNCPESQGCPYYLLCERKIAVPQPAEITVAGGAGTDGAIGNKPKSARRPFRLYPHPAESGSLVLDLTLIGVNREVFTDIAAALLVAGHKGLGPHRQQFTLESMVQLQPNGLWLPVYDPRNISLFLDTPCLPLGGLLAGLSPAPPTPWEAHLVTALRVGRDGQLIPIDWGFLFKNLAEDLTWFTADNANGRQPPTDLMTDLKAFLSNPGEIDNSACSFNPRPERYSSRQQKKEPMGGYQGVAYIRPPAGAEAVWWRWWEAASIFHLGKKNASGLGKIEISQAILKTKST